MRKYKNLKFWIRSVDLATEIYELTSNIAEGAGRSSDKDFKRFLDISYGSLYELQTQLIISNNLRFVDDELFEKVEREIIEIQIMVFTYAKRF